MYEVTKLDSCEYVKHDELQVSSEPHKWYLIHYSIQRPHWKLYYLLEIIIVTGKVITLIFRYIKSFIANSREEFNTETLDNFILPWNF